ncbi:biotin--[acetyl-CoA-carboxylase] ligase [bacterium]|nr:MAG: biotin--[acetyl-CoA-carboxylase] ligase [bacterium]
MLSIEQINHLLGSYSNRLDLHFVDETESTNTDVKRLPAEVLDKPYVLFADHQTSGRGQYDRKWESESGKNGICSIAYRPKRQHGVALTGLLLAVAISETVEAVCEFAQAEIKWPNDVYVQGKKLAGILVEAQFRGKQVEKIVLGFGININQGFSDSLLQHSAVSLASLRGLSCNREELLAHILRNFFQLMELWEVNDPALSGMVNRKLIGFEKNCTVKNLQTAAQQTAWVNGVDHSGRLGIITEKNKYIWFEHEQIRLEPHS